MVYGLNSRNIWTVHDHANSHDKFTFVVKSREMHIGGINTVKVDTDPWLRACFDAGFSKPKMFFLLMGIEWRYNQW